MTSRTCCGTTHFCQTCIEKDKALAEKEAEMCTALISQEHELGGKIDILEREIIKMKKSVNAIRLLSGIFTQETNEMTNRLYMCCLLARYIAGDAEEAFVREQCKKYGVEI